MGLNSKCPTHGNLHPAYLCPDNFDRHKAEERKKAKKEREREERGHKVSWFRNKVVIPAGEVPGLGWLPKEVIYEVVTGDDKAGFGFAVADIKHSRMHIHHKTVEIYIYVSGKVMVKRGEDTVTLSKPGDAVVIPPGTPHYAAAHDAKNPARVAVLTIPPWSAEDHILLPPYPVEAGQVK